MNLILALAACGGPTVATIDAPARLVTHDPGRLDLRSTARDASGEALPDVPVLAVAVSDDTVARVGKDGSVACQKTGTTTLQVQAGEALQDIALRCLLISAIEPAHKLLSLEVPSERGRVLEWRVLGLDGQPVDGVPVDLAVADASVARVEGSTLHGVTPGRTTLTWTAGERTAQAQVRVGKAELVREALVVAKGGVGVPLKAGDWTLTVSAAAEGTVEVFEGRCSESPAGKVHHLVCRPEQPTKLHIEPTGLLRDPTTAHVRGVFYPGS